MGLLHFRTLDTYKMATEGKPRPNCISCFFFKIRLRYGKMQKYFSSCRWDLLKNLAWRWQDSENDLTLPYYSAGTLTVGATISTILSGERALRLTTVSCQHNMMTVRITLQTLEEF